MRHQLYQNFYDTLKRFVEEEKFFLEYQVFGERYEIAFDKKRKTFYFREGNKLFPRTEDVYKVIKSYVDQLIIQKQKEIFNGAFKINTKYSLKFANESDIPIFQELVKKFSKFLWEEPITPFDINMNYLYERIQYAFEDSLVQQWFITEFIGIIQHFPKVFETGIIYYYMWGKSILNYKMYIEQITILEEEGYIVTKVEFSRLKIVLTRKFFEILKKYFYYDYDPAILFKL